MGTRDQRFETGANIIVVNIDNAGAVLKNLSSGGLCIESDEYIGIIPNARYTVNVLPEEAARLDRFNLEIESRWVKSKKRNFESGFAIMVVPGSKEEESLIMYLGYLEECCRIKEEAVAVLLP
jgi:hypothetical protein